MSKQSISLGTAPTGAGGDDSRSAMVKINSNFDEIYAAFGGNTLPASSAAAVPVLGTMSPSSTTAIFERGSNANGEYVRYADGTQLCWTTGATLVPNAGLSTFNWTFPIQFSARPGFAAMTAEIGAGTDPRNYTATTQYGAVSTTVCRFQTYMATAVGCGAFAIGRWK